MDFRSIPYLTAPCPPDLHGVSGDETERHTVFPKSHKTSEIHFSNSKTEKEMSHWHGERACVPRVSLIFFASP